MAVSFLTGMAVSYTALSPTYATAPQLLQLTLLISVWVLMTIQEANECVGYSAFVVGVVLVQSFHTTVTTDGSADASAGVRLCCLFLLAIASQFPDGHLG
jgi:hypothetical protein